MHFTVRPSEKGRASFSDRWWICRSSHPTLLKVEEGLLASIWTINLLEELNVGSKWPNTGQWFLYKWHFMCKLKMCIVGRNPPCCMWHRQYCVHTFVAQYQSSFHHFAVKLWDYGPFSQNMLWLFIAGKAQVKHVSLTVAQFHQMEQQAMTLS